MYAGRFTAGPPSVVRKKVEGKQSMLPKPRRTASTDRASTDARRPSTSHRSSSAEPPRNTLGPGRLSRETSASKLPLNKRSRTHQVDRYMSAPGQSTVTPLRSSQYARTTTTPRTPSEDRQRNWQTSLDRALAFIAVKDQRPISSPVWQKTEFARVQEGLALRGLTGASSGQPVLTRPLTITRFVDVCSELLAAIIEHKLNNDNYVAKLPNVAKRLLYPGTVSKSWLKTVNTLHAWPQALAFMGYFLDLFNHIETPVSDEWLYAEKDEIACLRRQFLYKSYVRFQTKDPTFGDLVEEYVQELKQILGHDEGKVAALRDTIMQCQASLEDETELAARAEEERLRTRRDALAAKLRALRAERRAIRSDADVKRARQHEQASALRALDADINTITEENQQLKRELEHQEMSVSERARLLDEVDYVTRVIDSKRTLADQVSKMVASKEKELTVWQQRTLDSCVEYKHALIQLAARCPELARLAVDEKELMDSSCAVAVARAVDTLRAHAAQLADQRAVHARARAHLTCQRGQQLEECRANIAELKALIAREQQALEADLEREANDAAQWAKEKELLSAKIQQCLSSVDEYNKAVAELDFWEKQDAAWNARLSEMRAYIASLRAEVEAEREKAKRALTDKALAIVDEWNQALDRLEELERQEETKEDVQI